MGDSVVGVLTLNFEMLLKFPHFLTSLSLSCSATRDTTHIFTVFNNNLLFSFKLCRKETMMNILLLATFLKTNNNSKNVFVLKKGEHVS